MRHRIYPMFKYRKKAEQVFQAMLQNPVRHEETQRPFFITSRQFRMGQMNMGEICSVSKSYCF
jgi:hypothetical protein